MINRLARYVRLNKSSDDPLIRKECEFLDPALKKGSARNNDPGIKPGYLLYMTGFAGDTGAHVIAMFHKDSLRALPENPDIERISTRVDPGFKDAFRIIVNERGVYQSLFELHELSGLGFEVDIERIPVSPFTCEITEQLDLNPFKLLSTGCEILAVPESANRELINRMMYLKLVGADGYPVRIGHLTEDKEMKLICKEGVSLLNRPKRDELLKILDKEK